MIFSQLWDATVRKKPELADLSTKIVITAEQYRKALEQAYHFGREEAKGKSAPDLFSKLWRH